MKIGMIGGSGMLGRTIASSLLRESIVAPEDLWISNRSGRLDGFDRWPGVIATRDTGDLVAACDVVILSVPPAAVADLASYAPDRLVISVMAGVTLETLRTSTGSPRVVRAMSSPAAEFGLAYSPWVASAAVTAADRAAVAGIFGACGLTDELDDEALIDVFTALTGPVPGFAAYFAECMERYAVEQGVPSDIAHRSIAQLLLGSGTMLMHGSKTAAAHVQEMIDYAGTTAAGLDVMRSSSIAKDIANGLDAAVARTRSMG